MSWFIRLNFIGLGLVAVFLITWMIKDSVTIDHESFFPPSRMVINDDNLGVFSLDKIHFFKRQANNDWKLTSSVVKQKESSALRTEMNNNWYIVKTFSPEIHVFKLNQANGQWRQHQIIQSPTDSDWGRFGVNMEMGDGRLFLNDFSDAWTAGDDRWGEVYVYTINAQSEQWEVSQSLNSDNLLETIGCQEGFGSVIKSLTDNWLAIGSYSCEEKEDGTPHSLLHFFKYDDSTGQYKWVQKVLLPDRNNISVAGLIKDNFQSFGNSLIIESKVDFGSGFSSIFDSVSLDTDSQTWKHNGSLGTMELDLGLRHIGKYYIIAKEQVVFFDNDPFEDGLSVYSLVLNKKQGAWQRQQSFSEQIPHLKDFGDLLGLGYAATGGNRLAINVSKVRFGAVYNEIHIFKYESQTGLWQLEDTIKSRFVGPGDSKTFYRKLTIILLFSSVLWGLLALLVSSKSRAGRLSG